MKQNESVLDPAIVGRTYVGTEEIILPEKVKEYAKATNETNLLYYEEDEKKLLIPPIFPVTLLIEPFIKIMTDDSLNLDFLRMVHGEHEIIYFNHLKPLDTVKTTVKLESIDRKDVGDILWAKIDGIVEKELKFTMRAGLFFKKVNKTTKRKKHSMKSTVKIERKIVISKKMQVAPDQSKRYAAASGDINPIHLDPDIAKAAGLPDIILHGLCTLAFTTAAIVDELSGGDSSKVKSVRTRFSRPVFMNDVLTTEGWVEKQNKISQVIEFITKNQRGEEVLSNGKIELLK